MACETKGPLRHPPVQLRCGDEAAAEGQTAHDEGELTGHLTEKVHLAIFVQDLGQGHQGRRPATKPVEQGDHLGHLEHRRTDGHEVAHGTAQSHGHPEQGHAQNAVIPEDQKNCGGHGEGTQPVAPDGRPWRAHPLDAQEHKASENDRQQGISDWIHGPVNS